MGFGREITRMPGTRSDLGQFFTPRAVIDVALEILRDLGAEVVGARVCDPACGPGEWLHSALCAGAAEALGIDCDPAMPRRWSETGLSSDPRCRLLVADGLAPALELTRSADVVLGNPPFGAELSDLRRDALRDLALHYNLARKVGQPQLLGSPSNADIDRVRRFPTEVLFLERFVEICRPDGWIAIILPEGVFANSRWRYVRRWLLDELTVHVVAALPRATFRAHATTARTCLLLMQRRPPDPSHEVALCRVDDCTAVSLARVREAVAPGGAPRKQIAAPLDLLPPIFRE